MSGVRVRPMTYEDVEAAYRNDSIAMAESFEEEKRVRARTAEEVAVRHARYRHLIEHDPGGAWIAFDGGQAIGSALALRREGLWILSLLAVDAEYRGMGVGKELLERALAYGEGCRAWITASSIHPAAMRRYALAGMELRPTLMAGGIVRREALPSGLAVREGTEADLDLAAEVDRRVRGAAHGSDLSFFLEFGCRMLVRESSVGRGYAFEREGTPILLAATEPGVAAQLLWTSLANTPANGEVEVRWLTDSQQWALPVVLAAGLALSPSGPLCAKGEPGPLTPYIPSNIYL